MCKSFVNRNKNIRKYGLPCTTSLVYTVCLQFDVFFVYCVGCWWCYWCCLLQAPPVGFGGGGRGRHSLPLQLLQVGHQDVGPVIVQRLHHMVPAITGFLKIPPNEKEKEWGKWPPWNQSWLSWRVPIRPSQRNRENTNVSECECIDKQFIYFLFHV